MSKCSRPSLSSLCPPPPPPLKKTARTFAPFFSHCVSQLEKSYLFFFIQRTQEEVHLRSKNSRQIKCQGLTSLFHCFCTSSQRPGPGSSKRPDWTLQSEARWKVGERAAVRRGGVTRRRERRTSLVALPEGWNSSRAPPHPRPASPPPFGRHL